MSEQPPLDKQAVHRLLVGSLSQDLDVLQRAAQTAYEAATHEENVAENKYDTLGLEASYLATGQARRVEEIRLSLKRCEAMPLPALSDEDCIEIGALLTLEAENGSQQRLFLAPDAAGIKLQCAGVLVTVISPRSPLGSALLGKQVDEQIQINVGGVRQTYQVLALS